MSGTLFGSELFGRNTKNSSAQGKGRPRVSRPNRRQVQFIPTDLEGLLSEEHQARIVWEFVEGLDLSPLYEEIEAVEGGPGRSAIDPAILMALWLYATVDGIGSARKVDRLCLEHNAYRWICGGVSVNHHILADFRVENSDFVDHQLTASVAALMAEGLVDLKRVSQDGIRIRASAGAASFRQGRTLEQCLSEAQKRVETLRLEVDKDPGSATRGERSARERAAQDRKSRVEAALRQLPDVEKAKKKGEKDKARVSTTDADARVMKMGDGGYRPAYNGQFSVDTKSQVIVGVDMSNVGSDKGMLAPMIEQIENRYGHVPEEYLVDGGFVKLTDIEKATASGATIFAPVPKPRGGKRDPHSPLSTDSAAVAEWRQRMGTDEAKMIYRDRAASVECANAAARNRGLQQFVVRGVGKVKAAFLWFALAHVMMRAHALRSAALQST